MAKKKDSSVQIKEGTIYVNTESTVLSRELLWFMPINKIRILRQARNRTYMDFS